MLLLMKQTDGKDLNEARRGSIATIGKERVRRLRDLIQKSGMRDVPMSLTYFDT